MLKNKKVYIVFVIFILCVIGIYALKKPNMKMADIIDNKVSVIKIFNGNTGKEINVDNKEDINKIIKNLNNAELKKDKSSKDFNGFSFSMKFYNLDGKEKEIITINSSDTIIYNDYFYKDKNNSIDYDFINSLFSKYTN